MKFGNTMDFTMRFVKIAIVIIIGVVLFITIKAVLDFAKNPVKQLIDFADNFLNETFDDLRACVTCKPSDDDKKSDPSVTNICGGTGIPFLNGNCMVGITIFVVLAAFILGAVKKAFNYFSGNTNEKLSDIYKRTSGKDYKSFKDQLDEQQESIEDDFNNEYKKYNKDKGGDTPENRKAFEKATADNFRSKQSSSVSDKLKNVSDEDLIKMIKSEKINSSMRDFTSGAAKSGGSDLAALAKSKQYTQTQALDEINKGILENEATAEKLTEEDFGNIADSAEDFDFAI